MFKPPKYFEPYLDSKNSPFGAKKNPEKNQEFGQKQKNIIKEAQKMKVF